MQRDFEIILNEFLKKAKEHFDEQSASLRQYERFFQQVQESFPAYSDFVNRVTESLYVLASAETTRQIPLVSNDLNLPVRAKTEPKTILIVDDAEINRILLGHFFKNIPATLEFASSGEQALKKVSEKPFDLILMDLQMKGMGGIETIRQIRENHSENVKKTQIIAISNLEPTESEKDESIAAGADAYLTKSLSREAMKQKVFEFLYGSESISA